MVKRLRAALLANENDEVARFEIEQKLMYIRESSPFELIFNDSAYANFSRLGFGDTIKKLYGTVLRREDKLYFSGDNFWQSTQQQ